MFALSVRLFATMLIASCIAVPTAYAAGAAPTDSPADATLSLLESIQSVRIGAQSAVITLKRGPKAHPIVIDYGDVLKSGALDGGKHDAPGASPLPKGFSLGQIAGAMLGLTVISRFLRVVRQVISVRKPLGLDGRQ